MVIIKLTISGNPHMKKRAADCSAALILTPPKGDVGDYWYDTVTLSVPVYVPSGVVSSRSI